MKLVIPKGPTPCRFGPSHAPMNGRKIILHTGVSLDGFIARLDGTIDWLNCVHSAADTSIYSDFLRSCDTALMGRATFEQVRDFVTKDGATFPYTGMDTFVFSRNRKLDTGGLPVKVLTEDAVQFVRGLIAKPSSKNIHLIGGGQLNGTLLKANLVHQIVISIIPTIIGQGIRLFENVPDLTRKYRTLASTTFTDSGMVQITLETDHDQGVTVNETAESKYEYKD